MKFFIVLATLVSTLLGGFFALRYKDKLHLILGFSAGAVIGVAFFDLLPEALELGKQFYDISTITSVVALGFIGYMILDRLVFFHCHDEETDHHTHSNQRGILGAASLAVHSFLDGAAIGLAFQVSYTMAGVVAAAVLVHDFSDGINTVNLILKNSGTSKQARSWLFVDAAAPVLGFISTLYVSLPENAIGLFLAVFAGFFFYIGASDLLPESHHNHPRKATTLMTLCGIAVLYLAIHIAGV